MTRLEAKRFCYEMEDRPIYCQSKFKFSVVPICLLFVEFLLTEMGDVSIHGNFVNKFNHAVDNIINTIDNDEVIARKILERRENILKNKEDLLVNLRQENENLKVCSMLRLIWFSKLYSLPWRNKGLNLKIG